MQTKIEIIEFILKEWLLMLSAILFVTSIFYTHHFPSYSRNELEVVILLYMLFIVVQGLEKNKLLAWVASFIEKGNYLPLKLIAGTFALSMVVTIDVALIIMVPITLSMARLPQKSLIVTLESLAAVAGSSLTPFGKHSLGKVLLTLFTFS